jgi:hypothetical protein
MVYGIDTELDNQIRKDNIMACKNLGVYSIVGGTGFCFWPYASKYLDEFPLNYYYYYHLDHKFFYFVFQMENILLDEEGMSVFYLSSSFID